MGFRLETRAKLRFGVATGFRGTVKLEVRGMRKKLALGL